MSYIFMSSRVKVCYMSGGYKMECGGEWGAVEVENMWTKQSNYFKYFKDLTVSSTNLYTHGFDRNIVVHICIHVQNESVS